jgi:hypothetical protein
MMGSEPPYAMNNSVLQVNVGGGVCNTECSGIFITQLPYKFKARDIHHRIIREAGVRPVEVKCRGDKTGIATAKFSEKEEAAMVVDKLDGVHWGGCKIRVRLDEAEYTVVKDTPDPASAGGPSMETT